MKKYILAALTAALLCIPAFAQEGTPVKSLNGSGPPNANLAHVVGTEYIDTSTSPATWYVCSAVTLTSTLSQCTWTAGGSSSSASSTGPVINVTNSIYAGGASSSNADNNAAFTAAVAALVAATNAGQSSSGVGTPVSGSIHNNTAVTNLSITIPAGNTNFVILTDGVVPQPYTITDSGGSVYQQITKTNSTAGAASVRIFATLPGQAKASTTVTATNTGVVNAPNLAVVSYPGVVAYQNPIATSASAVTSTSISQSTSRVFGSILLGCGFFNTNIAAFTATTGNLRTTIGSTATTGGVLVMDNSSGAIASVTDAGNYSAASNTVCFNMELQSNSTNAQIPTLYFPAGYYNYSGGLSITVPAILRGEAGSQLCYTGSAHAVDIGPTGLDAAVSSSYPYFIDGLEFDCGATATQGIFLNRAAVIGGIRNTNFRNFGPISTGISSGWMIAGQGQNWDWEIGPQVHVWTTDGIPRNFLRSNIGGVDEFSFFRVHNIEMYCMLTTFFGNTNSCSPLQAGIGMWLDSHQNIVDGNSLAFFNPDLVFACTAGVCYANRAEHNIINAPTSGAGTCKSPLSYQGAQQAWDVHDNVFDMNGCATTSPIGFWDGTGTLQATRTNFNTADLFTQGSNPFIAMNNTANQTFNQSSNNMCNTAQGSGTFVVCAIPHTTGANITPYTFNLDDGVTATGTAPALTGTGACATITTQSGSWAGQATCTGATGASTFIITPGITAAHGWQCDASDITTANALRQSAVSTTACTISGTVNQNDVLTFKAVSY